MSQKTPPGGGAGPDRAAAPRNDRREAFRRGTTVDTAEDQLGRAANLEESLEALRIRFEQYFLGVTRKPPVQERAALRSAILQLKAGFIRNTAAKFRVNMLHNRFLTYERLWDRTLREIEDGTYRRDLFKARLHRARAEGGAAELERRPGEAGKAADRVSGSDDRKAAESAGVGDAGLAADRGALGETGSVDRGPGGAGERASERAAAGEIGKVTDHAAAGEDGKVPDRAASGGTGKAADGLPGGGGKATEPTVAGEARNPADRALGLGGGSRGLVGGAGGSVPPPTGPAGAVGGLDAEKVRAIHAAYVEARRRCRESTDGITVEAISAALRKQVPGLLAKHQARTVDFQVVIQNGKAVLKAIPR
jgi:hypothetical protein